MKDWTISELASAGEAFCTSATYQSAPYGKRNWGGQLHSLCSYQGKLKPSIAHFLVRDFTLPGDSILDPMSGVGTIPLEARRQGRLGLAGDLSPLAHIVSRAKLEPVDEGELWRQFDQFKHAVNSPVAFQEDELYEGFGLNRPLREYFHKATLREIIAARSYFLEIEEKDGITPELATLWTAVLHILHGNRPYALSRRSHPITPFAPQGETIYKSVAEHTSRRLGRIIPTLVGLSQGSLAGDARRQSYSSSAREFGLVDAVITSPPFAESLRFWSSNWMRLWFAGWEPNDFKEQPVNFLEAQQRKSLAVYADFAQSMADALKPGGSLILHLGETKTLSMADEIMPLLAPDFDVAYIGRESVEEIENHGLKDRGATLAHTFLFAVRRS